MSAQPAGTDPRLRIRDLDVTFATDAGEVHAVQGVSLFVDPGEILAIVGESGSGKTVTARSILGLLPETATTNGAIIVEGTDVVGLSPSRMREIRGRDVSMVFQEPSSALNPVYPVWWQMAEGLRAHNPRLSRKELRAKAVEALSAVGIPDAATRIDRYPHEFSGGRSSASSSRWRCRWARDSSSRTSRRRPSTSRCRRRSCSSSATCATNSAPPSS